MLKIMMLGIALVAIALLHVAPTASAEPITADGFACSDGHAPMTTPSGTPACVFEESMMKLQLRGFELTGGLPPGAYVTAPIGSGHGAPLIGSPPVIHMSHLPEIGETAVVTVTYTNEYETPINATIASTYQPDYATGVRVSPGFTIVNNGGLTFEPFYAYYHEANSKPIYYGHLAPTALAAGESVTYTIEVRAATEGLNFVGGVGYYGVDKDLHVYLDDAETLHWADHIDLHPERYARHVMSPLEREQAEEARLLAMLADAMDNPPLFESRPLVGDELIEAHIRWVVDEKAPLSEIVTKLSRFVSLDTDDIRRILIGAGFSESKVNDVLPADDAPVSKSSHEPIFLLSGTMTHEEITHGHDNSLYSEGIEVCAYDSSLSGIVVLDCDTTDHRGYYELEVPVEDPDNNGTNVDVYIRVDSIGPHAEVQSLRDFHYGILPFFDNNSDGFNESVPISLNSSHGAMHGAVQIIDGVTDTWNLLDSEDVTSPRVTIYWESGKNPSEKTQDPDDDGSFYQPGGAIYLDGSPDHSRQRFVQLHEYGHFVMDRHFDSYPRSGGNCNPHYIHNMSGAGCAWSEGWADFLPGMVDNRAVYNWYSGVHIDLEQGATINRFGTIIDEFVKEDDAGMLVGQVVEGRVAAALWDIKDANITSSDTINRLNHDTLLEGNDEIIDVFQQ